MDVVFGTGGRRLSSMKRANGLRLLRSACVSMRRLDGDAPTAVSDSKWPNSRRGSTRLGLSAIGTRIGMRGPFDLLPLALVRCRLPLGGYCLRSQRLLRFRVDPLVEALVADAHARVGRPFGLQPAFDPLWRPSLAWRP